MKKKQHSSALEEKAGVPQPESISNQSVQHIQQFRRVQPSADELVDGILAQNITALSRAITLVESTSTLHLEKANTIIKKMFTLFQQIHSNRYNGWFSSKLG